MYRNSYCFVVVLIGMASRTPVAAVETLSEAVAEPEHKRLKIDHGSKSKVSTLARGEVTLNVSQDHKKLTLQIAPSHPRAGPYLPGEQVSMDVAVVGPDGKPVTNAEVCIGKEWVVEYLLSIYRRSLWWW